MSDKLLPCPFCGSDKIESLVNLDFVACQDCGASLEDNEPSARALWNRRAEAQPSRPVSDGADLATWFDEQIAEAKKIQIAGFAAGTQAGNLHGERSHARQCALYEAKQKALATPPSAQEQVFIDACNEAGCSPDNEALLQAIAGFKARITELETRINTPQTGDWLTAVPLEAAHQIERYGAMHDAGKSPWDWFWLIGYLAQKAADAAVRQDPEKAKHHTISTAAALLNWHRRLCGEDFAMRPGIADPAVSPQDGGIDDQSFVEMLWKWFEDRGCDLRSERVYGLSADEFRIMLDEHEAAIIGDATLPRAQRSPEIKPGE